MREAKLTPDACRYAGAEGRRTYYEIYGQGDPLVLLQGYAQFSRAWLDCVDDFKDQYQVVIVDLHGHGKSDAFSSELSIVLIWAITGVNL
ncbi:MAG: pimeloyl-ACP methyl ester carboxylesterase [Limisphaerales bacterium]